MPWQVRPDWARPTVLGLMLGLSLVAAPAWHAHAALPAQVQPPPMSQDTPVAARARPVAARDGSDAPTLHDLPGWCQAIGRRLNRPTPLACPGSGLKAGEGRSVAGIPLWFRDIEPADGPARLRVLVIGGIHGDEKASVHVVFDWLARASQARMRPIHWRIVPLLNPDGLLRKPSTRTNGRGVDLNRNFPTADWDRDAQRYWTQRTRRDPRRYPGPSAMSEPETRWLHGQIGQFQPQLIVAVHAPYGVLDFDGPPPPPNKLGSLLLDQVGVYPGSLGNYAGVMQQVPVVTVELKNAERVAAKDAQAIWTDLLRWMDRRLLPADASGLGSAPRDAGPTR